MIDQLSRRGRAFLQFMYERYPNVLNVQHPSDVADQDAFFRELLDRQYITVEVKKHTWVITLTPNGAMIARMLFC